MRFPVFLDANVLFPPSLADTLLRLSEAEVIRPHWSPDVMDELETARPRLTLLQILASLERISLTGFAAEVRRRWPDIAPPSG